MDDQQRRGLVIGIAIAVVLIAVLWLMDQEQSIVIGVVSGSAYGLVALGLVLIYKSSGVFNFAQGEFGGAAICTLYLLHSNGVPYGLAVVGALLAGMLFGFLTELIVIRPLFEAPRVIVLVATAGVALLAIALQQWLFDNQGRPISRAFPTLDRVTILGVQVSDQRLWLIGTLAVLAVVLGLFFTKTNLGLAIIGASQEPTATELVGISVRRLSTFTWVLAALLGALAAVIAVPDNGAVHARGHDIGLPDPRVHRGRPRRDDEPARCVPRRRAGRRHPGRRHRRRDLPGHPRYAVDAHRVPRAAGRVRRAAAGPAREDRLMAVATAAGTPPDAVVAPEAAQPFRPTALGWIGRGVLWAAVAALVLVLPLSRPGTDLRLYAVAVCFAIVALSLNVLLGYVGQISLGHAAFVGIGAFTSAYLVTVQGQSFWVGVLAATAIGGAQALVLGGVSLRIRGLYFALITLSYGLVAEQNIFQIQEFTGGGAGQRAPKPDWFESEWRYYYLCLAFLAVVLYVDWRMMRTKGGRALLALRENPRVASTFGINVRLATLFAFVVSGAMAGLAGALIAHGDESVSA